TQLLAKVVKDERRKGTKVIIVNAGKGETRARRFYEKNSFAAVKEVTMEAPWDNKITLVTYQLQLNSD
ncbi:MAG: hypothetical protein WAN53_03090, partial [Candidatus Bathyarchaeia archaeon]